MGSYTAAPFSAYGSLLQGNMTNQSLNNQAGIQEQNAAEAESQGQQEAKQQGIVSEQKIGQSVASYGASGVTQNSGSVGAVIGESHANAELDRLNILHGADIKATNYDNQATMDRYGANSALLGSYWSALGQIAGGTGSAISQNSQGATNQNPNGTTSPSESGLDSSGANEPNEASGLSGSEENMAGENDIMDAAALA